MKGKAGLRTGPRQPASLPGWVEERTPRRVLINRRGGVVRGHAVRGGAVPGPPRVGPWLPWARRPAGVREAAGSSES
uniref:Uncharacterized protein n=1 Tax=Rangifer tarandus platyrhynchus TaxID=3082113 RepID=A0ACB0DY14_RANTA|nr:unnamed protein product [Rangifer tarandus platyrhynchus]